MSSSGRLSAERMTVDVTGRKSIADGSQSMSRGIESINFILRHSWNEANYFMEELDDPVVSALRRAIAVVK
jgi:hypothetical protein